jgi:hypothetical protein
MSKINHLVELYPQRPRAGRSKRAVLDQIIDRAVCGYKNETEVCTRTCMRILTPAHSDLGTLPYSHSFKFKIPSEIVFTYG